MDTICSFLCYHEVLYTVCRLNRAHNHFVKHDSRMIWQEQLIKVQKNANVCFVSTIQSLLPFACRIRRLCIVKSIFEEYSPYEYVVLDIFLMKTAPRLEELSILTCNYPRPLIDYPLYRLKEMFLIYASPHPTYDFDIFFQREKNEILEQMVDTLLQDNVKEDTAALLFKPRSHTVPPLFFQSAHTWNHDDTQYSLMNLRELALNQEMEDETDNAFDESLYTVSGLDKLIYHVYRTSAHDKNTLSLYSEIFCKLLQKNTPSAVTIQFESQKIASKEILAMLQALNQQCSKLNHVSIMGITLDYAVSNYSFPLTASFCKQIEYLNMRLSNTRVLSQWPIFDTVKRLDIFVDYRICIKNLVQSFPNVQFLTLKSLRGWHIEDWSQICHLSKLKQIRLERVSQLDFLCNTNDCVSTQLDTLKINMRTIEDNWKVYFEPLPMNQCCRMVQAFNLYSCLRQLNLKVPHFSYSAMINLLHLNQLQELNLTIDQSFVFDLQKTWYPLQTRTRRVHVCFTLASPNTSILFKHLKFLILVAYPTVDMLERLLRSRCHVRHLSLHTENRNAESIGAQLKPILCPYKKDEESHGDANVSYDLVFYLLREQLQKMPQSLRIQWLTMDADTVIKVFFKVCTAIPELINYTKYFFE